LAGFCAASRPLADMLPWGSYEGWCALVRQAVIWVSGTDPADTRLELIQTRDEDASLLRRLIAGWPEIDPHSEGVTIADALRTLADAEEEARLGDWPAKYKTLRDALDEIAPRPERGPKAAGSQRSATTCAQTDA